MKIDRRLFAHWVYLALFAFNVACALLVRWTGWRRGEGAILLYGHKLNGNLAALETEAARGLVALPPLVYLTMDPAYHRQLICEGRSALLSLSPRCIPALASARAIVTDHGLHVLSLLTRLSRIPLFDVWHGIPFKGFDATDFAPQHRYDEAWVSSELLARMYVERFGFEPSRVVATGYARTDRLVRRDESRAALLARFGLESIGGRKTILFAPTWKQDESGRSLIPFGVDEEQFFGELDGLCERVDAVLLFRAHLNSGAASVAASPRIFAIPHSQVPDTEGVLLLSDVLVCDWSSIAFDFLVLDRPTLFLDVSPPFRKGFSLGPEYRFGEVLADFPSLLASLEQVLRDPGPYQARFHCRHQAVKNEVYGPFADGKAARRGLERLAARLLRDGSSR